MEGAQAAAQRPPQANAAVAKGPAAQDRRERAVFRGDKSHVFSLKKWTNEEKVNFSGKGGPKLAGSLVWGCGWGWENFSPPLRCSAAKWGTPKEANLANFGGQQRAGVTFRPWKRSVRKMGGRERERDKKREWTVWQRDVLGRESRHKWDKTAAEKATAMKVQAEAHAAI